MRETKTTLKTHKTLDIVNTIKNNPKDELNDIVQSRILTKVKETFTEEEQSIYFASLNAYLNHDSDTFVVPFNDIWEWMGYFRKDAAKAALINICEENVDYIDNNNLTITNTAQFAGKAYLN